MAENDKTVGMFTVTTSSPDLSVSGRVHPLQNSPATWFTVSGQRF